MPLGNPASDKVLAPSQAAALPGEWEASKSQGTTTHGMKQT